MDIKIFRMNRLGIPQDRIASKRRQGLLSSTHQTHIIQAPMSAQRFSAVVVSAMQKKRILGVTSRYVIVLKQQE
jgi:hypothetical protein